MHRPLVVLSLGLPGPTEVLETQPIQSTASTNGGTSGQGAFTTENQDESKWLHQRAIISGQEAATIIGKGGENVTLIRKMSGAKCTVSEYTRGAVERILTVSGLVATAVAKAFGLIIRTLNNEALDQPCTPQSKTYPLRLLVPHVLIGSVIGQKGGKIREIQGWHLVPASMLLKDASLFLASVHLLSLVLPMRFTLLHIMLAALFLNSSMNALEDLLHLLMQHAPVVPLALLLADCKLFRTLLRPQVVNGVNPTAIVAIPQIHNARLPTHTGCHTLDNSLTTSSSLSKYILRCTMAPVLPRGGYAGAGTGAPQSYAQPPMPQQAHQGHSQQGIPHHGAAAMPGQPLTQQIYIPNDMVGAIIGKGGAKINEIRQLSGSVIKINEPQDNSNERLSNNHWNARVQSNGALHALPAAR